MPQVSTPRNDPWDEVRALKRQVAELERRVNTAGTMKDSLGNILAATDATTGMHLGRPYLPITWASSRPAFYDFFYASGSSVPETIWHATVYKQHPAVIVAVEAVAAAGETGALRLLAGGVQVGSDAGFGATAARVVFGPVPVPGGHLALVTLELQAWRTAGSGLVRCWPQDSWSVESP